MEVKTIEVFNTIENYGRNILKSKTSLVGYAATSTRRRTPPLRQTSSATSLGFCSQACKSHSPQRGKQETLVFCNVAKYIKITGYCPFYLLRSFYLKFLTAKYGKNYLK